MPESWRLKYLTSELVCKPTKAVCKDNCQRAHKISFFRRFIKNKKYPILRNGYQLWPTLDSRAPSALAYTGFESSIKLKGVRLFKKLNIPSRKKKKKNICYECCQLYGTGNHTLWLSIIWSWQPYDWQPLTMIASH